MLTRNEKLIYALVITCSFHTDEKGLRTSSHSGIQRSIAVVFKNNSNN